MENNLRAAGNLTPLLPAATPQETRRKIDRSRRYASRLPSPIYGAEHRSAAADEMTGRSCLTETTPSRNRLCVSGHFGNGNPRFLSEDFESVSASGRCSIRISRTAIVHRVPRTRPNDLYVGALLNYR